MTSAQRLVQLAADIAGASTASGALRRVTTLRRELDAFERRLVAQALAEGATFASIARELGISRQAVHRRFRHLMPSDSALGLSGNARRVLLYAREEALAAGAATLTGAHVLAGTLRAAEVPAAAVLRAAGATLERTRTQIAASVPRSPLFRRDTSRDDLRALLQAPAGYARERGEDCIEVEHLLLGVLEDDAGAAAHTLRALGVDVESVRDALTAGLESRPA